MGEWYKLLKDLGQLGFNFNTVLLVLAILLLWLGKERVARIFGRAVSREPDITIINPAATKSGATIEKQNEILQTLRAGKPGDTFSRELCDLKHYQIEEKLKQGDGRFGEIQKDIGEIKLNNATNTTNLGSIKDTLCGIQDFLNIPVSKRR
jgi:hypothetical protein